MGALHDGHLSLVRAARKRASRVIVSIFVNPAQFAPSEDFKTYPRTFNTDLAMLGEQKVDLIWAPTVADVSADGFSEQKLRRPVPPWPTWKTNSVHIFWWRRDCRCQTVPGGRADFAMFGEKDYQQF